MIKNKKKLPPGAAALDLGNWLNGNVVLYLDNLASTRIGINLAPNPL